MLFDFSRRQGWGVVRCRHSRLTTLLGLEGGRLGWGGGWGGVQVGTKQLHRNGRRSASTQQARHRKKSRLYTEGNIVQMLGNRVSVNLIMTTNSGAIYHTSSRQVDRFLSATPRALVAKVSITVRFQPYSFGVSSGQSSAATTDNRRIRALNTFS